MTLAEIWVESYLGTNDICRWYPLKCIERWENIHALSLGLFYRDLTSGRCWGRTQQKVRLGGQMSPDG